MSYGIYIMKHGNITDSNTQSIQVMCLLFMLLPFNAFHRQERAGTIHLLREAATKKGVKVRILKPEDELRKVKIVQESRQPHEKIGIRFIQPHLQTKVSILI